MELRHNKISLDNGRGVAGGGGGGGGGAEKWWR